MNSFAKRIPYAAQWIEEDDIEAVAAALKSSNLTQGPLVEEFERQIADYCGARYAVAVNSGTSALHIACLTAEIAKGDEVITSPITFVATPNSVLYCGGKPVFADVNEQTINIDPKEIREKISSKTKAVIPVHFAGNPCDLEGIYQIAKENNLIIIEDAAHALGAEYKDSKIGSCKYSDMTVLSFHAVKHITTGEGGMVLTNNEDLYEKLKFYRSHGITRDNKYLKKNDGIWYYEMHHLGHNYRLTDIQCALGSSQLKKMNGFVEKRREIARKYEESFKDIGKIAVISETSQAKSSYHLYVVMVDNRELVFNKMREANITVNVHYIPVYLQPYYQRLGYVPGLCPKAEEYYARAISLPMFPKLSHDEQLYVIASLNRAIRESTTNA